MSSRHGKGSLCLLGVCLLVHTTSAGAARQPGVSNGGHMLSRAASGKLVALPLKHTDVDAQIAGVVAAVEVTQQFVNPFKEPIEATYVFPLPREAAIHAMTIQVGDRVIQGVVRKRARARAIYERARRRGQTAALLEQERPNIFTQSVANILPGEAIRVSLRYVETLAPEGGRYEFVFPMVVGPRYVGGGEPSGTGRGDGWGVDSTRIPDASRVTPRLLRRGQRSGHDIAVKLRIDGGVPVRHLQVVTHQASVAQQGNTATVVLDPRDAIPNRDFVVRYQLAGQRPEVAVLTQRDSRGGHFLLMIQPKAQMQQKDIAPREYVFVVDNSGSMDGFPLRQARAVIKRSLENLRPTDTFQIIKFAGMPDQLAPRAVRATPANVRRGVAYVTSMRGGGGTEFLPALELALGAKKDPGRSRIVLFVTDGYIGYEHEVLRFLRKHAAGTNVFALGVGSSVNRFLIDGMARIGSGAPFYLLSSEKASSVVERIFATISRPALTHIDVEWGGLDATAQTPRAIPDLFGERPVVVAGRFGRGGTHTITVHGRLAGQPFARQVQVTLPDKGQGNPAVAYLWARRRIAELMDIHATEPERVEQAEKKVTQIALSYNLMSRFTSFVAVDRRVRTRGGDPRKVAQPVPLPDGVSKKAAPPGAFAALRGATGSRQASIFGCDSAAGSDSQDALGGLIGNQIGESYGVGGLGLAGAGRGGGGVGQGSIGLGTLGTIGKGGGGGSGVGYGRGVGRLAAARGRAPGVVLGRAGVQGALSKEIIRRVIRRHVNEVRYAYQRELQRNPGLQGRVVARFTIGPSGQVVASTIASSSLGSARVEQDISSAVRRWQFPKPKGGGIVQVTYPFVLRGAGGAAASQPVVGSHPAPPSAKPAAKAKPARRAKIAAAVLHHGASKSGCGCALGATPRSTRLPALALVLALLALALRRR